MLNIALLAVFALAVAAIAVYWVGDGDFRHGRTRSIRRVRATRRRFVGPLRARVGRAAAFAWTRPVRASVAAQVRRVVHRVERASAGADRFVDAEQQLGKIVAQLEGVGPVAGRGGPIPGRRASRETVGRGWLVALALSLAGAAVAGANAWGLYEYVLPAVPGLGILPADAVGPAVISITAAVLPFLLGLAYYAFGAAGESFGLRLLRAFAVLLVVGMAALQAAAVVVTLETMELATPTWWGGIAVATLLGGAAALVPPIIASLSHSAVERLAQWLAARERRAAGRSVVRQDEVAARLRETLDTVTGALEMIRGEVVALSAEPAGRLLLHPSGRPTVEQSGAVLRRLAVTVERDPAGPWAERPGVAEVLGRSLLRLGALFVWVLAAAGALWIVAPALRYGAEVGSSLTLTGGTFAALAVLLLGGLVLRLTFSGRALRAGPVVRGAAVAVLVVGTMSLATAIAPLAAAVEGGFFEARDIIAGAWLNLLVLAAALASLLLPEGIGAAGSIATFLLAGTAWIALGAIDAALAVTDWALRGFRPHAGGARPRPDRAPPVQKVSAVGPTREPR